MHAANADRSERLQRALSALREAGERGLTSMEWILKAQIVAPGTVAPELRKNGYNVTCECEGKIWRYRLVSA
jgi:hypothetical protein